MRYLVTRNRLGQSTTTDMDEFVDGKPTGKIVVQSQIIDGEYKPIYEGEEPPFKPDPKSFNRWFQKQFGNKLAIDDYNEKVDERGTFAETISEPEGEKSEVYILEFDWEYGHRTNECKSKKDARERFEKWQSTFYWAEFTNLKIYKEIRFRIEIIE